MQIIVIPTVRMMVDKDGLPVKKPQHAARERLGFRLILEHEVPATCAVGQGDLVAAAAQLEPDFWMHLLKGAEQSDNVPEVDKLFFALAVHMMAMKNAIVTTKDMPDCGKQAGPSLVKP